MAAMKRTKRRRAGPGISKNSGASFDSILINTITRVERPARMPWAVLLFTNHPHLIEMTAADAELLADRLRARIDAGADLTTKARLTEVIQTTLGRTALRFSPEAARDYVALLRHL